jgi:uncharacterized protein
VECKTGERALSRNIIYFAQRTAIPRFYQVHLNAAGEDTEWADYKARILPFVKLAKELKL